ncbi:MAG: hypothetical protein QOJ83_986 [Frankiales bacterium]|nr:hypothetical protein [Frankiales bacterium]
MNDDELRGRFDLLVDRVRPNPDADPLVRGRAARIRRNRSAAAVVALSLGVVVAVAVPETLQHQAKSARGVPGGGLSATCDPVASDAARRYGMVERMYGASTTASALAGWRQPVGGDSPLLDALEPGTDVPLCLLVGTLDGPATATAGVHYALLAVVGDVAETVYFGSTLPTAGPMPGVAPSQIQPWSGPAPSPAPAVRTTDPAATILRSCASGDLSGELRAVGLVDGLVQGEVVVVNTSATGCSLSGSLTMAALTSAGKPLPIPGGGLGGPVDGVYAPLPVSEGMPPTSLVDGHLPATAAGGLVVTVGGDPSAGTCAPQDRLTRPATFRLTIGAVSVDVANTDATANDTAKVAVYGCPSRFYAGSATGQ